MTYNSYLEKLITDPASFSFFGFTIVRKVIDDKQIEDLRQLIKESFDKFSPDARMLLPRHIIKLPELYNLVFHPKIVSSLKKALGDPYVQWGDLQVQRNMFGSWHVDSGSENMAPYLFSPFYRFVKCGLFLQDNTSQFGGGIGIRWFSHKLLYNNMPSLLRRSFAFIYKKLERLMEHDIKLNAGDFIFFDSRLMHTSTLPQGMSLSDVNSEGVYPLPYEGSKFVFYWNASNECSREDFMRNSMRRALMEEYFPEAKEIYFIDYLMHHFPTDFPNDFVQNIKANHLEFASLDKKDANKFKALYDELSK